MKGAAQLSAAVSPAAAAVPTDDGSVVFAAEAEPHLFVNGAAPAVAGWATLMLNAANLMSMLIACYELHKYLNEPHPDNDSYYLAALAYFIFVPSLLASFLILAFVGVLLWKEYHTARVARCQELPVVTLSRKRWYCLLFDCLVLFLLSCWPAGCGIVFLDVPHWGSAHFRIRANFVMYSLWVAGCLSFAVFAALLLSRSWRTSS